MTDEQESSSDTRSLTVLFIPDGLHGPMNQCIGIGDVLQRRGHRVAFVVVPAWAEKITSLGFEKYLVNTQKPGDSTIQEHPGEYWTNYVRDALPKLRQTPIVQLETYVGPTWHAVLEETKLYDQHLSSIIDDVQPDVIVLDNVACYPTVVRSGIPYVRMVSCNPLEIPGENIPPAYSGLPQDDDSQWNMFKAEYARIVRPIWEEYSTWVQSQGVSQLPELHFIHDSAYANIYIYPQEADYILNRPLDSTWHRIDSSVRKTDVHYELPFSMRDRPKASNLVYVSLGSLGCADVTLMQRLIDVLSRSHHYFIVSKGPLGDCLKLSDSMTGESTLPQTAVIPQVDLVITHGGNNTVTEALHFGKPMIILPIFWDQHDNAQRMHELGFGIHIDTYQFHDEELLRALDKLLGDTALRHRMARLGEQIRQRDGLGSGGDIIEQLGRKYANRSTEKLCT